MMSTATPTDPDPDCAGDVTDNTASVNNVVVFNIDVVDPPTA